MDYHLEFFGKFNCLLGDSSTGKSAFWECVHSWERKLPTVTLECSENVHAVTDIETVDDIKRKYDGYLLVIDENCTILHCSNFAALFKHMNNRFLLICRKIPRYLPIALTDCLELRTEGRQTYSVLHYNIRNMRDTYYGVQKIITEDSDAGLDFFKTNYNIPAVSSCGNGSLLKTLKEHRADEKTLVVCDAAALASIQAQFFKYVEKHNVQILAWTSFEHFILGCKPIECAPTLCDITYSTLERQSTALLSEMINYSKKKLPNCLKLKPCDKCGDRKSVV